MSALDRSAPRFCFNPRSMASRSEIGITPVTSFAGTLPANGLTPPVPGMGWPGELVPGVVSDCARHVAVPHNKTPASRQARLGPYVNLKGASLIANLTVYATALRALSYFSFYSSRCSQSVRQILAHLGCTAVEVTRRDGAIHVLPGLYDMGYWCDLG